MTDGRVRLLLVEDDEDDYLLTRDLLAEISGSAYALDWVATYEAAQEAIRRREHDVYLLDYRLGAHSGLDLVREIVAAGLQAPSILLTGQGDRRVDAEAMEAGATDYLVKSEITPALLERAVRYARQRARLEASLKESRDRMAELALHDSLTGLPNRMLFEDRLQQALGSAKRAGERMSLLLIDLDGFKAINDTFGHDAGDTVLQVTAARLKQVVRGSDTVARQGGDEFAVLLPGAREAGAIRVANKIRAVLAEPVTIGTQTGRIGASIGIAVYPDHGADANTLKGCADLAMYTAKAAGGGGYTVYLDEHEGQDHAATTPADDLRRALAAGELCLHYQPILTCENLRIEQVEAQVCWRHPREGLIPSDRCMTLAEHAGAGTALSIWVLEETLRQCRAWQRRGVALRVAAQVHSLTLLEPQLPDLLTALLRHYAVPPEDLTLQFTEAALTARPEDALAGLDKLAGLGVRLSVTNYGTGQLSIDRLRRLPLHELRLDRSFLADLERTTNVSLLSCMVQLGAALGLRVVVKGVETRSVFELMLGNGCTALQGTYVSGPRSAENVEQWLRQGRSNGDSPSPRNTALPAGRAPGPASSG